MDRRRFLRTSASLPLVYLLGVPKRALAKAPLLGAAAAYDFGRLKALARALAKAPYRAPAVRAAKVLKTIDFARAQRITYRPEASLFEGEDVPYTVRFFPLSRYVTTPVSIYAVSARQARPVVYSPHYFDFDHTGLDALLPKDAGFAGLRVMDRSGHTDWLAFEGASYFRSAGALNQYGLSARGIAIDTGLGHPEEFPRFSRFFIHRPVSGTDAITIDALLEGPSLTGAFRFVCRHLEGAILDVHAELFIRRPIARLGLAPLTSMYWYGSNDRKDAVDWRPQVHDSDGLEMWAGTGERIWRPLENPPVVATTSFEDDRPRGFGLLQRDRRFADYEDDGAWYNRRPSAWVAPRGDWGRGAVMLVELPTDDETEDNIVAFWHAGRKVEAGAHWSYDYRLYWVAREPFPPTLGRVVATYVGRGGVPGQHAERNPEQTKFVIDFEGGPLAHLKAQFDVDCVATTSRGQIVHPYALEVVDTRTWRGVFDAVVPGRDPVDLRCFLRLKGKTLTETWLYHYFPGDY